MKTIAMTMSTALLALSTTLAAASDFDAAAYHDSNCMRCHDNSVYTRDNRRVRDHAMLEAQVARCDAMLETKLFPDDLALLVDHLNRNFYKFTQ
ncbi:MAG: hypothetical protein QNJ91_10785 [Gammaproteobacteria bacterium]|nr:hypothetical protein [Gammaproteobacteria bacterium]